MSWSARRMPRPVPGTARSAHSCLTFADRLEAVLAVAEEGEVVVGQPADEVAALLDLGGVDRRRVGLDVLDERQRAVAHLAPVLDRLADVAEHALEALDDLGDLGLVDDAVDLDVHPRLFERVGGGLLDDAVREGADASAGCRRCRG